MATKTRATVEDVLRLSEQGQNYELIDGELVPMSPTNYEHGEIEIHVGVVLYTFVVPRRLGSVLGGDPLFQLDREQGIGRAPDIAFVRKGRAPAPKDRTSAFHGVPDLAVEIVSPSNTAEEIQAKVDMWLAYGTLAVLVMYPGPRGVVLWRSTGGLSLHGDDVVDLDPVIPGFRCKVSDLFPPSLDEEGSEHAS